MQPPACFTERTDRRLAAAEGMILVGASVRAAAQSAKCAGMGVIGVDLFADTDTVTACDRFVHLRRARELPSLLRRMPPWPVMHVGGLVGENELLGEIGTRQPVLGCSSRLRRELTDPLFLSGIARAAAMGFPMTVSAGLSPSPDPEDAATPSVAGNRHRWLRKDPRQSGGLGVRWIDVNASPLRPASPLERCDGASIHRDEVYLQRWIPGRSFGATFLSDRDGCRLLGVCRSSFNRRGGLPFVYAGSSGPVVLPPSLTESLSTLGERIGQLGLRGLFGVDFVVDPRGRGWLLEVNPRWTASSELIERSMRQRGLLCRRDGLIAVAAAACGYVPTPDRGPADFGGLALEATGDASCRAANRTTFIKRIVYARRDMRIESAAFETAIARARTAGVRVELCDLPADGSPILAAAPIATLIAEVPLAAGSPFFGQLRSLVAAVQQTGLSAAPRI